MENLKLEKLIICLFLFTVVTGRICSPNAYNQDINNCKYNKIIRNYNKDNLKLKTKASK